MNTVAWGARRKETELPVTPVMCKLIMILYTMARAARIASAFCRNTLGGQG